MDELEFRQSLQTEVVKHSAEVTERINRVLQVLPANTRAMSIIVSPGQDGDGLFDIFVSLDGPDLHVLNKQIREYYALFSPVHTASGIQPCLPEVDPFAVNFAVNDAVADVVVDWLCRVWESADTDGVTVPVRLVVDEGYGATPRMRLE